MTKCATLASAQAHVPFLLVVCALSLVSAFARAQVGVPAAPAPVVPTASAAPAQPRARALGKIELAQRVTYEQQRLERALAQQKLDLEPAPEGKRIAFIRIVRDDVFVKEEIWPLWWNWFHGRTREEVVRRELLFQQGAPFEEARIEETMRNMRGMGIFTMVRIAAVKGARPDEVGVLVMTRDIWSLRIETDVNVTNDVISTLLVRLTELNAFGQNKTVSADITIQPTNYLLTESFYARRMLGTSFAIKERAGLVYNRLWNTREGEIATLSLGQPFYRLSQRFAWTLNFIHDNRVYRNTRNGVIRRYLDPRYYSGPVALQVYRARVENAYLSASYRSGERVKQTISAGWDFRYRKANPTWETDLPDALRDAFRAGVMPRTLTDNGPTLNYDVFVPTWVTLNNIASFGVSENVRTGPALSLATRVPVRALGATYNAWVVSAAAGWTFAPKGCLVDLLVSGLARLERRTWIDQRATFQVRGASPVFSIFRFVMRAYLEMRRNDTLRTYVSLGGDNGLRGYQAQAIAGIGTHRMLANFELRTLPIMWQAVHLGGVIFYDVGSIFNEFGSMRAYQAAGVGLRLFLPQFNRQPFSLDAAMAFDNLPRIVPTVNAGQTVPLTAAEDATD